MKPSKQPEKSNSIRIKILTAVFDFELPRSKIPAFRAAVIEKAGREHTLFHNHLGDNNFRYAYPLIQYKTIRRNPAIICIGEGTEEILNFFSKPDWNLVIHGQHMETQIKHIGYDYFVCELCPYQTAYRIHSWFCLNEDNYRIFGQSENETEKIQLLERILIGNILSFAKGMGWHIDGQIQVTIPSLPDHYLFTFKEHQMTGFTLDFRTNVLLPDAVGLGKSVSRGFGMITRRKSR